MNYLFEINLFKRFSATPIPKEATTEKKKQKKEVATFISTLTNQANLHEWSNATFKNICTASILYILKVSFFFLLRSIRLLNA